MSRRRRRQQSKSLAVQATRLPSPVFGRGAGGEGEAPGDRLRRWLLAAVVALLVVRPLYPSESPAQTGDGLPVVMLWIAVGVLWMLGAIGRRQFRVRFGWTDAAVLGLIAWHTLAAVVATHRASPRPALNMLWEWVGLGLAYFLARQFIATRREARAVVAVMIGLAVGLSGYGLYQVACEMPKTRAAYEANAEKELRKAGLWFAEGSPERAAFEKRLESREPLATFALTNSLAGYLAPWLVVAAGIALGAGGLRRRRAESPHPSPLPEGEGVSGSPLPSAGEGERVRADRSVSQGAEEAGHSSTPESPHPSPLPEGEGGGWRTWIAVACCAAPVVVCLVLTKSRSAYLATLVGLIGLGAWRLWPRSDGRRGPLGWKRPAAVVLAVALVLGGVVAASVATGGLDRQVLSQAPLSLRYRLEYWQATMRMIADHPLLGCGPGNFQQAYMRYKLPQASEEVADPHNFLLEVWATAGTPAMLALLAVLGTFGWTLWRGACSRHTPCAVRHEATAHGVCLLPADATAFVFGGGAFGFVLAGGVGLVSAAPPGAVALALALALAAGAVALLWPWIRDGRLPPLVLGIGVVVLLVNLLAAGGIGFAGVAVTLWLLTALGLNLAGAEDRRTLPWSAAAAGLVLVVALAFACHTTAYGPVLRSQAAMDEARHEPEGFVRIALLKRAAEWDPLAAKPHEEMALVALGRWLEDPRPEGGALDSFNQATALALRLSPNSATLWGAAGEQYFEIGRRLRETFAKNHDPACRDRAAWAFGQAVEHYQQAVALYPNSAANRAGLAEALRAAGDREGFAREAQESLRLDGRMPHVDKKLPDETREKLLRELSRP